jgi:alginate O-acetyltransferase complex protein AlgI
MLFTSIPFLLYFMPVVVIGYQLLGKIGRRPVIAWLALTSVLFYAVWNPKFVLLLLGSMALNFFCSRAIAASATDSRKKAWMIAGVALNLTALGYYKYLFPLLGWFNSVGWSHRWSNVILPLGISFFTFTQIAYLVDLAQGEATAQSFPEYALFVTFFPHLIAGPILHHREMMPQFSEEKTYSLRANDFFVGLSWFIMGLAKKSILADKLAPTADYAFAHVSMLSPSQAWVGVLSYAFQLYFDFSGYSDMAIGVARMFSIRFPMNFNSPYKAANIIDFWSRWHITLTRYLTLYLYDPISLAISRRRLASGRKVSRKAQKTLPGFASMVATPMLVTMFIAGIWHGAGLQFLIFGLLHGVYLCVNHAWRIFRKAPAGDRSPSLVAHSGSVLLTFACVLVGQVFFRANSTADALGVLRALIGWRSQAGAAVTPQSVLLLVALAAVVWLAPNTQEILGQAEGSRASTLRWLQPRFTYSWPWAFAMGTLLFGAILFVSNSSTFLYFQF